MAKCELNLPFMWSGIVRHFLGHVLASTKKHGAIRRFGGMSTHGILASERFNKWINNLSAATNHVFTALANEYSPVFYLDVERLRQSPSLCCTPVYLRRDLEIHTPVLALN
jgi:hypothetical protein